jgi:hypothetical protein
MEMVLKLKTKLRITPAQYIDQHGERNRGVAMKTSRHELEHQATVPVL